MSLASKREAAGLIAGTGKFTMSTFYQSSEKHVPGWARLRHSTQIFPQGVIWRTSEKRYCGGVEPVFCCLDILIGLFLRLLCNTMFGI